MTYCYAITKPTSPNPSIPLIPHAALYFSLLYFKNSLFIIMPYNITHEISYSYFNSKRIWSNDHVGRNLNNSHNKYFASFHHKWLLFDEIWKKMYVKVNMERKKVSVFFSFKMHASMWNPVLYNTSKFHHVMFMNTLSLPTFPVYVAAEGNT